MKAPSPPLRAGPGQQNRRYATYRAPLHSVRVNQNGGAVDFSRIAGAGIERVEIVRGAQSSLWGSDAIGSVVQVFTKRAGAMDAPQVSATIETGSFDTQRGDVRLSGGARQRVDYHAGISYRGTEGAFADLLPENDWFEQTTFDGGAGAVLGSRVSVRTSLRYGHAQGRAVGPITYGSRDTGTRYNTKDLSWNAESMHTLGRRFTGTASVGYFRYRGLAHDSVNDPPYTVYAILEGTPNALFPDGSRLVRLIDETEFNALSAAGALPAPGQFLASSTQFDFSGSPNVTVFRRSSARYQGDYTSARGQRLSAGYEFERETSRNPANTSEILTQLDNNAVFIQQQFSAAEHWFVTVGARADARESYDTFFSPKLSAGGYPVPFRAGGLSSVKVFGNIGKGIKSPTFLERFGASFADPNPDLRVERARTADIGAEATFADQRIRTQMTYFNNDYMDQIAFRFGTVGDGIPEFINIDGSKASGWEFEAALRPVFGVTALGHYALVDTEVVTNLSTSQQFQPGQPLLRRPKHSGALRLGYTNGPATVNFDLRIVGQRHDNSVLFMTTVPNVERPTAMSTDITVNPDYTVAGIGVEVRAHEQVTIFVRGDNLGNTVYDSALGFPGMPRSARAGVRFNVGGRW